MMKENKTTIVAAGIYRPGTGFTRVLDAVFLRLANDFEIHFVGLGYSGPILDGAYTVYPTDVRVDVFGAWRCAELATEKAADVVFLCNDILMIQNYRNALSKFQSAGGQVIAYCPLDGKIVDDSVISNLAFLDQLVLYHEFALEQIANAVVRRRKLDGEFDFPRLQVIPHGLDCSVFFPLRDVSDGGDPNVFNIDRSSLKSKFFAKLDSPHDSFVVLNANRYDERKRIDLTIKGFGEFAQGKENVWLYLHHSIINQQQLDEIDKLADAAGCRAKILLNQSPSGNKCISSAELNELYNVCDVGINTSMGEGWGLVSFEHAATGAAQIMPRVPNELLWHDNAVYLKTDRTYVPDWNPNEMVEIDAGDLATCLNLLFSEPQRLSEKSSKAFGHATNQDFDWDIVAGKWSHIFEGALQN